MAEQRHNNATKTLDERPTYQAWLDILLNVFIHCGRFHVEWAERCGAVLARVRGSSRVQPLTPDSALKFVTPCPF